MNVKYDRLAKRVEDVVTQVAGIEPSINLQIIVDEAASPAEIKAEQRRAIAEHIAEHPEDRGKKVGWWIIHTIVHVKGERAAAYEPPRARDDAPPPPPMSAPKPPLVDWDAPALK
jgi:hypothetical protein